MSLSAPEFRAAGAAMFGDGWQTAMALRLGVNLRTVQRWALGETPLPEYVPLSLGMTPHAIDWPRDRWIVGFGEDESAERLYVVHAHDPRFLARVVRVDNDDRADPDEEPADLLGGVTIDLPGARLCEVVWLSPCPAEADLVALMREAAEVARAVLDDCG